MRHYRATFWFYLMAGPAIVGFLSFALLLNCPMRFRGLFRTIYYVPSILPSAASAAIGALRVFDLAYAFGAAQGKIPGGRRSRRCSTSSTCTRRPSTTSTWDRRAPWPGSCSP